VAELAGVAALVDIGWIRGLTPTSLPDVWVSTSGSVEANLEELGSKTERVTDAIRSHLRRQGAMPMAILEDIAAEDGKGLALCILRSRVPVSEIGDWWVPHAPHDSVLLRRVKRVLAVSPTIPVRRLRSQLKRDMKKVPPRYVLAEILRHELGVVSDATGLIDARPLGLNAEEHLSRGEQISVQILADAGGALPHREFLRRIVGQGLSAALGVVLASKSVVLNRPARGVAGVLGALVPAETLEAMKDQSAAEGKAFLGWRNVGRDAVELRYSVESDLFSTTVFHVPSGMLPTGSWSVEDGQHEARVEETYLAEIHDSIWAVGLGERGIVTLTFDRTKRQITIRTY
jgi:hypothetical protein